MKSNILTAALFSVMLGGLLTSCNSSTEKKEEKVADAREDLNEAKDELNTARADSAAEVMRYRSDAQARIDENNQKIAEIRTNLISEKRELKVQYEKQVDELEKRNAMMKTRLEDFKDTTKDNWDTFKISFNQDMDDLGKSISDLADKNRKRK